MSYAEAVFTVSQLSKPLIAPATLQSLSLDFDVDNEIAVLSGIISDATVDSNINVKTIAIEIWRQKSTPITEYGQGTKLDTVIRNSNTFRYEDNYASLIRDDHYYYALYTVGDNGLVNKSAPATYDFDSENVAPLVWGFIQDFSVLDPDPTLNNAQITYPEYYYDSNYDYTYYFKNFDYTPMHNDTTNNVSFYMNPGDYQSFLKDVLKNEPWMVKFNNMQGDYRLDPLDYSKRWDSPNVGSDFDNAQYNGGPFSWVSKMYTKEIYIDNGSKRVVMFSNSKIFKSNGFEPIGFRRKDEHGNIVELEGQWLPMGYTASGGKLHGGATPLIGENFKTEANAVTSANALNAKFLGGEILNFLRDVEFMLFKTCNIQKAAGYGLPGTNPVANQNIKGSGYTYNGIGTYDESNTGFQGCSVTGKNVPGKMFHSQVLGSYGVSLDDPNTCAEGTGGTNTLYVRPFYTYDTEQTISKSDMIATTIKSFSYGSGWKYPSILVKTDAGSFPHQTNNSGSATTGLCDGLFMYASSGSLNPCLRLGNPMGDGQLSGPSLIVICGRGSLYDNEMRRIGCATLLLPSEGYTPYN